MCEGRGHRRTYVIKSSAPIKIVKLPNLHAPKKQTEFSLETTIYVNKRYDNPTEKTKFSIKLAYSGHVFVLNVFLKVLRSVRKKFNN